VYLLYFDFEFRFSSKGSLGKCTIKAWHGEFNQIDLVVLMLKHFSVKAKVKEI